MYNIGYRIALTYKKVVKNVAWHPRGDYFSTVLEDNSNSSVIMNQLSRQKSVRPFAKMTGLVQQVVFHPNKPILFVAVRLNIYLRMKKICKIKYFIFF
jgi:ribosome biogenesis protein ERB1